MQILMFFFFFLQMNLNEAVESIVENISCNPSEYLSSSEVADRVDSTISRLPQLLELSLDEKEAQTKFRRASFTRFGVLFLCVPRISQFFGVGRNLVSGMGKEDNIRQAWRDLLKCFGAIESGVATGSSSVYAQERCTVMVALLKFRSTPWEIIPLPLVAKLNLRNVLVEMTLNLLSVGGLCRDVDTAISTVHHEICHELASASRMNAEVLTLTLSRHCTDFFQWLHSNRKDLTRLCRAAEVISCIDPKLHAWLKGEEYESPMELVSTYNLKYKEALQSVALPFQPFDDDDVSQAQKDLQREVVHINSKPVPGHQILKTLVAETRKFLKEASNKIVDSLVKVAMVAASRTAAGGDGYFIVEELYGADGLALCPIQNPQSNATGSKEGEEPTVAMSVTSKGLHITIRGRQGLYQQYEADLAEESPPLMEFETAMTSYVVFEIPGGQRESALFQGSLEAYMDARGREALCRRKFSVQPVIPGAVVAKKKGAQ